MKSLLNKFEDKFIPEPNSGCWLWISCYKKKGYGYLRTEFGSFLAHRLSYILYKSYIPGKLQVLHKCDVRCCVNPEHLFLGTNIDNVNDKVSKNRQARGDILAMSKRKLTLDQVLRIRQDGRTQRLIAKDYGVSQNAVYAIKNRLTWKTV